MSVATSAPPAQAAPVMARSLMSLYVGDLHPDVTEAILYEMFSAVGPVASIRVCRDHVSRRSLGYAYVNFQSSNDADRALDTYKYTSILGRPCRIMWSQRDPALRRSGVGNIFVNGLDKSIDVKDLDGAFSIFGNILSCKIAADENGVSTGRGYIQFQTNEMAKTAIEKTNNTLLGGKKIVVSEFVPRKQREEKQASKEEMFTNVYVKNLPEDCSDEDFKNLFSKYGTVTSSIVMRDDNGKSKGFGFANLSQHSEAKAAAEALNNSELNGKKLYAGRAQPKHERKQNLLRDRERRRQQNLERSKGVNLYIKNLNDEIDDNKLRRLFESFGAIASARVMRDERNDSKGFGFVCFNDPADATRAVSDMNGKLNQGKPLYVALAQPKEERRQQLSAQWRQRQFTNRGMPVFMNQGYYMFNPYQVQRGFQPTMGRFGTVPRSGPFMAQQPFLGPYGRPNQGRPRRANNNAQNAGGNQGAGKNRGARQNAQFMSGARNTAQLQSAVEAPVVNQQQNQMQKLASLLANADPERQKQILGDNLYQIINGLYPLQAGKLTGMLLQMDNSDLLHLLEDDAALRMEVDKAHEVLMQHSAAAQPAAAAQ